MQQIWEDLEGAGGEGGGRGDRDVEDMWTQGLFISMCDKIHYKQQQQQQNKLLANMDEMITIFIWKGKRTQIIKLKKMRLED